MEVAKHEPATPINGYLSTEVCDVLNSTMCSGRPPPPATFVLRHTLVLADSPNNAPCITWPQDP